MAKDTDEIVVGANGTIWIAPVGTAAPASQSAAPGAGWVDIGFTSEDGVTLTDSKTLESINVWQLQNPARRIVTERDTQVAFVARQWNADTVKLAFGGGEVTEVTAGNYKYEPPDPEEIAEYALMVDWHDGDKDYRFVMPRGMVTDNVETNLVRTAAADLPITFGAIGDDGVKPFYILSNDPVFETA